MSTKDKKKSMEIGKSEKDRKNAVALVKSWVDQELRGYQPPVRSGIPKGDPIGFSLEKKRAALLMVLHPNGLQLKEIGKLAGGVSENVLRVWRAQKDFQKEIFSAYESFTKQLCNTAGVSFFRLAMPSRPNNAKDPKESESIFLPFWKLESADSPYRMLRLLASILRFFNIEIVVTFLGFFKDYFVKDKGNLDTRFFFYLFSRSGVEDAKRLRNLEKDPKIMDLNKTIISAFVDFLSNPENWKRKSKDEMEEDREFLKKFIFEKLDALAG